MRIQNYFRWEEHEFGVSKDPLKDLGFLKKCKNYVTSIDIRRIYTSTEIKEICLSIKSFVRVTYWNCPHNVRHATSARNSLIALAFLEEFTRSVLAKRT